MYYCGKCASDDAEAGPMTKVRNQWLCRYCLDIDFAYWRERSHALEDDIRDLPCYVARNGEGTYECRVDKLCPSCSLRSKYHIFPD